MADVLNPEQTESTPLSTEMETLTLDDAVAEQFEPSSEITHNPETESQEIAALDNLHAVADSRTVETAEVAALVEEAPAPATQVAATPAVAIPAAQHSTGEDTELSGMEDFAAALESFDREQAAEAAALAFDDNIVTGTVIKLTDKHVVVDVGLKSEGLIPIEQVLDHAGQPKLKAGDVVEVVVEREEPEGGYLVSYEKAQRHRVWDRHREGRQR
jgi:small subunit ribosomal protein S1